MVGIISYGTYIPEFRIKTAEIARVWKKNPSDIETSLGVKQKSVPGVDEDAVTLAIEAATNAFQTSTLKPSDIEVVLVGSESHPYVVNPTATIVGELLGVGTHYLAADLEFACKAATAGMQFIAGLIESQKVKYGLAIGSDTAQSQPHDALEYTSAAGSAAFILGNKNGVAELVDFTSYSSDTPDFWRRDGRRYPSHAGRFSGQPAFFKHVTEATHKLLQKANRTPENIDYCVFHAPNGKFPRQVAKALGFSDGQLAPSLTVDTIGNPYSASSLIGFAAVLDQAKPEETILLVSYGSGAGSDAFLWRTTQEIKHMQKKRRQYKILVSNQLQTTHVIDYAQYIKQTHKL